MATVISQASQMMASYSHMISTRRDWGQPKQHGIDSTRSQEPAIMGSTISVKQAAEAAVPTTSHPMAEPRTTAPVHRPLLCGILKEPKLEILEIAQTIHDNIDQQRADLLVCIPELRKAMCDLMEDHHTNVEMLATMTGLRHAILARSMHLDQLEESVKGALRHINHMFMDTEEEWSMIATIQATHIVTTAVAHRNASAQSGIQDKIAAAQKGYN
jgi:hypothetical protein